MTKLDTQAVMKALRARAPRAVHVGELLGELATTKKDRKQLREPLRAHLAKLAEKGEVQEMPGDRYRLPKKKPRAEPPAPPPAPRPRRTRRRPSRDPAFAPQHASSPWHRPPPRGATIEGYLSMTPRGFGFVAAEDGGPDVFIPPHAVGPALHGDRVEVVAERSPKGRDGQVVGILGRRHPRITGALRRIGNQPYLEPDDLRVRGPVELIEGFGKDGKVGDVVEARIVRFPQDGVERPGAVVTSVLGARGVQPGAVPRGLPAHDRGDADGRGPRARRLRVRRGHGRGDGVVYAEVRFAPHLHTERRAWASTR